MKIINMGEGWREKALCRNYDDLDFYTEDRNEMKRVKMICKSCPVADHCLKFAVNANEIFGVWGGFSQRERRTIRRNHKNIDNNIAKKLVISNGNKILSEND
jgi:hypothetical protein